MHVGLDLDDVILEFCEGLRNAVFVEFGVLPEPFTQWDITDVLNPIIGYDWFEWLRNRDWLWANFPATPGAIGYIERLRQDGHFVEIVTSKPEWAEFAVWKWLGKWRPRVNRVTIVGPHENKAHATDAHLLVDDRPENCLEWIESDPDRVALLFDRRHNQHFGAHKEGRIHRVYNWAQVYDFIGKVASDG